MRISSKQLAQALYDLTDQKTKPEIEKSVADFALYIRKNRKLKSAEKIIENFEKIYNAKHGIIEAGATTREKLGETELKKVKGFVKEKYGAKEVILSNIVDKKVLGGIILRVGDEIIDGSVKGRLTDLRKLLAD
ncbi:MAG: ATP synthase F1 subunit delta [Candidatus Moranbacteria bacterium]|nr:ATP synthase F1 subunit delta [Candidatus Moranbacteria bacterium]